MRRSVIIASLLVPLQLLGTTNLLAAGTAVTISKSDCQRLVRHQPSGDVEYKPGVDARGRPVVPADVGGARPKIRLPNEFTIDIGVDLGKRLGIGDGGKQFSSNVSVGTVKFDRRTGQVTFNGQSIGNAHTHALALKCREILSQGR